MNQNEDLLHSSLKLWMSVRRSQCQSQVSKEVCLGAYYTPFPVQLYNKIVRSGSLDLDMMKVKNFTF